MSDRIVVPLADGFEEIEAVTIVDVLRRAEVEVVTVGLASPEVARGAHGMDIVPDAHIDDIDPDEVTMIVLPGGLPGATTLTADPRVQNIIKKVADRGGWTCAICAAPMALGPSGVAADKSVTSYPGFGEQFEHGAYLEDRVVVDGRVITSRGPGTSLEFALTIVAKLCGEAKANELAEGMLVERTTPAHEA